MFYQVISQCCLSSFELFPTLSRAKEFIVKYYPKERAIIRHFNRYRKVTLITSYYPSFGFETKSIKQISDEYNKTLV